MNWVGALIVYLLVWWIVLFAVLPLGVRGRWESEDDGVAGAEPGAPVKPDLKRKALITTGVATIIWAIVCAVILSGVITLRD